MGSAGQQQKIAGLRKITIYRTIICYNSFKKKKFYFLDFLLTLEQPSNWYTCNSRVCQLTHHCWT